MPKIHANQTGGSLDDFRALRNAALNFGPATALIGENNCGKSAFLLALDLFFASSPRVTDKDFSDDNTSIPINITVHFSDLPRTIMMNSQAICLMANS